MSLPARPHALFAGALMLAMSVTDASPHTPLYSIDYLDEQIEKCLEFLAEGRLDEAGLTARQIARRFPDFALGQLIAAEMDSVRALQDVAIAEHLPMSRTVSELLLEARKRLSISRKHPAQSSLFGDAFSDTFTDTLNDTDQSDPDRLPGDLIQVGSYLSDILVVDLTASVLYQYDVRHQKPALVRHHYIGSGEGGSGKRVEGDMKTPLGVFSILEFRPGDSLPDLYGSGALTLDYPNALDRHLGRTGYGIWLHGVPASQGSRTPYSSEGCVTMSNAHLSRLSRELDTGKTRVMLTNDAAAIDSESRAVLQDTFRRLFQSYQKSQLTQQNRTPAYPEERENRETDYLSADEGEPARSAGQELTDEGSVKPAGQFAYRRALSAVKPEDISIFRYPDIHDPSAESDGIMVTEAVFGDSNEYQLTIYWARDASGQWQRLTKATSGHGT